MAFFYLGQWAVEVEPNYNDRSVWTLPLNSTEHLSQTLAPEDFLINPENAVLFPQDTQVGDVEWTVQTDQSSTWYILEGF